MNITKRKKAALAVLYGVSAAIGIFGTVVCALLDIRIALIYAAPFLIALIFTVIQSVVFRKKGLLGGAGTAETALSVAKFLTVYLACSAVLFMFVIMLFASSRGDGNTVSDLVLAVIWLTVIYATPLSIATVVLETTFARKAIAEQKPEKCKAPLPQLFKAK